MLFKNILFSLIVLGLVIGLTGCGSYGNYRGDYFLATDTTIIATDQLTIGFDCDPLKDLQYDGQLRGYTLQAGTCHLEK